MIIKLTKFSLIILTGLSAIGVAISILGFYFDIYELGILTNFMLFAMIWLTFLAMLFSIPFFPIPIPYWALLFYGIILIICLIIYKILNRFSGGK